MALNNSSGDSDIFTRSGVEVGKKDKALAPLHTLAA